MQILTSNYLPQWPEELQSRRILPRIHTILQRNRKTSNNQRLGRCVRSMFSRRGWFRDGCTMSRLVVRDRGQVFQTLKSYGITIDNRGRFETTRIICALSSAEALLRKVGAGVKIPWKATAGASARSHAQYGCGPGESFCN